MRADEHLARFEGEQALRAYEDALAMDSCDGAAAAGRVRALLLLGRYRSARYALSRLLVDFPRWPNSQLARGEVALGQRDDPVFAGILDGSSHCDFDTAREAFGEALRLDPACVQAWRGLATAFRINGQSDDAITILAKAESEIGWGPGLVLEHAISARDDGRLSDALACVREVLVTTPGHAEARIIEARLLVELERPEDAMISVDALERTYIDSAPAHIVAAQTLDTMIARSTNAARRSLLVTGRNSLFAAAFRDPGCSASAFYFAILAAISGNEERGKAFRRALAGTPESPALLNGLADQLDDDDDANGALDLVQRALEADPAYLRARITRVWALTTAGRMTDAETLATELTRRHPRDADVCYVAGWVEFRRDRFEAALEHAVAARESIPNSPKFRRDIGQTYRLLGNIPAAEQELRSAAEQWPGNLGLLREQAVCAAVEDRQREARIIRRKATAITLDDARALGVRGAGRRLMLHNLVSWLLVRSPDWEVNSAAQARLKRSSVYYKGRDRVPAVGHERIRGMLRGLDWDSARSFALADRATNLLLILVLLAELAATITVPIWATRIAGLTKPTITSGLYLIGLYVLMFLSFAVTARLTRYTRPRADIAVGGIIAAVIAAYFAIAHRELPSQIAFAVIIGIMVPVLFMEFLNILISASGWGVRAWERRASFRHPVAAMISGLLELSSLLDNKNVIDISARSRCVEIVEEVAQAQKRALVEPLSNVSGHEDAARAQQAERWMAGTVEATRRLKEPILASNTATVTSLRERAEEMLNIVCAEQWKDLPEESPPSGGKRARAWLSITAQTLVIAILPAAVLLLYQLAVVRLTHDFPHVPTWLAAVAYGIWPVITVLWRLDPDFPAKAGLFGRLGGAPGGTAGDSHQPPSPRP